MRKLQLVPVIVCLVSCIFYVEGGWGAEFCVNNATDLQSALTIAASNNADDTIKVVQGTYTGNFTYASGESHSITLQGGYTAACTARVNNPASTILDGNSTGRVLDLYTTDKGDISVDGFTVQNGSTPYAGGGICATSDSSNPTGDITITNNIIRNNMATMWGGGVMAGSYSDTTPGNVTIVNNVVTGNTVGTGSHAGGVAAASSNYAGSGTTSGTVTFINNTVTNNAADTFAGGVHVYAAYTGGIANFYNNIVWGNTASSTADFYANAPTANGFNNNYHAEAPGLPLVVT